MSQPPYSPEVNPVEQVFEEVRRYVEGRVYRSIEAKKAAEDRLSTLVGWSYIREASQALPQ